MSNPFIEAADQIRRLARQYESMQTAANLLDQLGSLEQAKTEAQAAVDKLGAERGEAKAALQALKDAGREQETVNANAVQAAHDQAAKAVALADDYAEHRRKEADSNAADVAAAAKANAEAIVSGAMKQKSDIDTLASQREAQSKAAQDQLATAQAELAVVEDKLKAARAAVQAALA